jgi:Uncharacterized ACR, COG1993
MSHRLDGRIAIGSQDRRQESFPTSRPRRSRRAANRANAHSTRLHSRKILDVSETLPLVIAIVGTEDKIKAFLTTMPTGLVTLEKVQVLQRGESVKHNPT